MPREHEWDSRWWSPIINAEHLAMRDRAGMVDLTAFAIFDVVGPGALDAVQRIAVSQCDVARRPRRLHADPRRPRRLPRRPHDHAARRRPLPRRHRRRPRQPDRKWFARPPAGGRLAHVRRPDRRRTPRSASGGREARDILAQPDRERHQPRGASRSAPAASIERRLDLSVLASRISYVGELGWELYVPMEHGAAAVGPVREAGEPHGARARSASASTARPAASRRATARTAPSSTASARSSRPACSGPRSRTPTSSAGRPTSSSATRTRDRPVHADRRRPHVGRRDEALHARRRAGPHA